MPLKISVITAILIYAFSTTAQSSNGTEIISSRSMSTQTFLKTDGSFETILYGEPKFYKDGGNWSPIQLDMVEEAQVYSNTTNVLQSVFPKVTSDLSKITLSLDGDNLFIHSKKELVSFNNGDLQSLSFTDNLTNANQFDKKVLYTDSTLGISDEYIVNAGEVKNNFVLNALPEHFSAQTSGWVGIRERLEIPDGWSIRSIQSTSGNEGTLGLAISDENNIDKLIIPAPIIYDNEGTNDGSVSDVEGMFVVEQENGSWYISTLLPASWLNSSAREFPVIIDPTVTLAGVSGGWQSQNNAVDNSGFVFIGVCCGNLEHRAWIKWNVSSIPDNACVTTTELQVYVNGVGASTTELVHAYDMMTTTSAGVFGPYGGINTAVYNDQGNGYYTSFNLSGTGTYGWYDLGPGANLDVMAMMNSYDFYQVALIFDNEPSTNWKRLTATLCNLRITYQDPPCVILPVELTDFNVGCEQNRASLKWQTASELDNDYFSIWQSYDGVDFSEVGRVDGNGNSQDVSSYFWTSSEVLRKDCYFKLTQTDFNGATRSYPAKAFHACNNETSVIVSDNKRTVRVFGDAIQEVVIYDQLGRTYATATNGNSDSEISLETNVTEGVYLITVLHHNGEIETQQIYLGQ